MSINNRQDLNDNIKEILDYDGPILVDIKVVPDENCYPMVAPGKSNAQMIGV
jgi:acetolactate synthase-1/2/3 large subunit